MEQISEKKEKAEVSLLIGRNEIPMRLYCKSGILGMVMSHLEQIAGMILINRPIK
jgi:hypothetical protein